MEAAAVAARAGRAAGRGGSQRPGGGGGSALRSPRGQAPPAPPRCLPTPGPRRAGGPRGLPRGPSALPSRLVRGSPLPVFSPSVPDQAAPGSRGLPEAGAGYPCASPAPRIIRGVGVWELGYRCTGCEWYLPRQATGNEVGFFSQARLGCLDFAAHFVLQEAWGPRKHPEAWSGARVQPGHTPREPLPATLK